MHRPLSIGYYGILASCILLSAHQVAGRSFVEAGAVRDPAVSSAPAPPGPSANGASTAECLGASPCTAAGLVAAAERSYLKARYQEAEDLYRRAIQLLMPEAAAETEVATLLIDLGMVIRTEGRNREAETVFRQAERIVQNNVAPEHPLSIRLLNSLALLHRDRGEWSKAASLLNRALTASEKSNPESVDTATILTNLGEVECARLSYRRSEARLLRALAIREKLLGPNDPVLAFTMSSLGLLRRLQKRYAEAEGYYRRALTILEQTEGVEHPHFATLINNFAALNFDQRRYSEAASLLAKAAGLWEKAFGPYHPNLAISLENLADCYRELRDFERAEPLYLRSLAILERNFGSENRRVGICLKSYSALLKMQKRKVEAAEIYSRATTILAAIQVRESAVRDVYDPD
jgi:tetratricopeptide (TPR) repeat protein